MVVGVSRTPAPETIAFALATLAVGGGVVAATVASADAGTAPNASIDYDGERLNVDSAPDQVISGTSTLEEDSQVTVRVRSSDSSSPFLSQSVLNASEGGDFAASFDFDDVEPGTEFAVSVHHNGTKLAEAPGVVGECDPACGEDGGTTAFQPVSRSVSQSCSPSTSRSRCSGGTAPRAA